MALGTKKRHPLLLPLLSILLIAGCESVKPDDATVASVAGTWDGSWTNLDYLLSTAGGASPGRVQMILEQRGRLVMGTLTALGLRATITGRVDGDTLTGGAEATTGQGSANLPITMRVKGAELEGTVNKTPLVLRRY